MQAANDLIRVGHLAGLCSVFVLTGPRKAFGAGKSRFNRSGCCRWSASWALRRASRRVVGFTSCNSDASFRFRVLFLAVGGWHHARIHPPDDTHEKGPGQTGRRGIADGWSAMVGMGHREKIESIEFGAFVQPEEAARPFDMSENIALSFGRDRETGLGCCRYRRESRTFGRILEQGFADDGSG